MTASATLRRTLQVAGQVLEVLHAHQLDGLIIGALALAVHGYPRDTRGLDLAIAADPSVLGNVADALRARGYRVEVRSPDAEDPLGGVVDVYASDADLVQIVNFSNPPNGGFPRLVADALVESVPLMPGHPLRIVGPYHLIAFKLYAGGAKSKLDVLELLDRNPELDRQRLTALCESYQLTAELNEVLSLERGG
jgi:hypothetical protein